jgi:hypothetical protein
MFDIFSHSSFTNYVKEHLERCVTKDEFDGCLKRELQYYFWSKCEWEVIISPFVGKADSVKIDVFDQVMLNWEVFVDYVWSHKQEDVKDEKN